MPYWIARNNQKVGPYSLEDVQRLRADGKLVASDLAWTDGMPNWAPALEVIPAPQSPEPPAQPSFESLAPTRMLPVMRVPTQALPSSAAPVPSPEVTLSAAEQAVAPPRSFQPASFEPSPAQAYQPPAEPIPAAPQLVHPAAQFMQPGPPSQIYPSPPAAPAEPFVPTQTMQAAPAYSPQPAAVPPQSQFVPPPPPAAMPYQPYASMTSPGQTPYQPYPGQAYPGQPMPAQPYGAQAVPGPPIPGQPMPAQAMPYSQSPVIPPGMHWALVLVLGSVTFGIFYIVWMFKQANFIQRIDPSNPARKLFVISILLLVVYIAIVAGALVTQSGQAMAAVSAVGGLVDIAMVVVNLVAVFKMRASMVHYYNTVEPIGLRLSGVMTLFFNILYFQHHFHRIAQWKQTGMLVPQK